MIGESNNPAHEVYIDGFGLEGDFIPYNTGLDIGNKINSIREQLTTGKDYVKYLNEKSTPLEFKTILTEPMVEQGYEDLLVRIVDKAMREPVKIMVNGRPFIGMVLEFRISFPPNAYREYNWLIVECVPFNPETKKFNTFNYKKATTATKETGYAVYPPSIELLLNCNIVRDCSKFKVKCVTAWQTRLRADGYYLAGEYNIDGQFCTFTEQETKKWQKHYNIKQTGKFDAATKEVLRKRFGTNLPSKIGVPAKPGTAPTDYSYLVPNGTPTVVKR